MKLSATNEAWLETMAGKLGVTPEVLTNRLLGSIRESIPEGEFEGWLKAPEATCQELTVGLIELRQASREVEEAARATRLYIGRLRDNKESL